MLSKTIVALVVCALAQVAYGKSAPEVDNVVALQNTLENLGNDILKGLGLDLNNKEIAEQFKKATNQMAEKATVAITQLQTDFKSSNIPQQVAKVQQQVEASIKQYRKENPELAKTADNLKASAKSVQDLVAASVKDAQNGELAKTLQQYTQELSKSVQDLSVKFSDNLKKTLQEGKKV